jgi:NADH-quinone oxidoreductase subunit E
MMTKSADTRHESGAADRSAELGRMAVEMLQNSPLMSMNPLMAQPAAAMAAATAIGFSVTTQMAGAFFGALQGAFDVTNRLAGSIDAQKEFAGAKPVNEPVAASVSSVQQSVVKEPATIKPKPVAVKTAVAPKPRKTIAATRKPAVKVDDLKLISGIGPKLEQVLNQRGIMAVADIAAWTEADVARIDAELGFDGRIGRDDWVGQAKLLTPKLSLRT